MKNKEIINRIEIHFGSQLKKDSQNLTHNGKIDLKKLLEESFECKISKSAFESLIGVKLTEKSKMQSDKVESPIYSEDEVDSFYDALANSTDKIIINHWRDEIIENDKWKIFDETSLNQENINEKSDSKYKEATLNKISKKEFSTKFFTRFLNYINQRKKNFTMYILLVTVTKVLIHFFLYRSISDWGEMLDTGKNGEIILINDPNQPMEYFNFIHHIEVVFTWELILFIPAFILVSLIVWFFNDKIQKR
tara:strand:- start:114 stop:863 length:750 start_codon:yes stop_codon:yes gene_type:complete